MTSLRKDQSGQTIVAVIMVMLIALSVGVAIANRFVATLRSSTRSDTSSRAMAVAEAAVERMLTTDYTILEGYINFGNCGTACTLQIVGADSVVATANVTLSFAGGNSNDYLISLLTDEVVEISLQSYPDNTDLNICWDSPSQGFLPSITGVLLHGTSGNYQSDAFSYNSIGSIYGANGFTEATSGNGYAHCALITGVPDMLSVRVRSVYNFVDAYVVTAPGVDLPSQGILIESMGTVLETERKAEVVLSSPYLPLPFDYALFSKSETVPLSN